MADMDKIKDRIIEAVARSAAKREIDSLQFDRPTLTLIRKNAMRSVARQIDMLGAAIEELDAVERVLGEM